jgi:alpha-galactosidase
MILNVCNFWMPGQINGTAPSFANSSWDTFSWVPQVGQSWRTDTDIGYTGNIRFRWVLRNLDQDSSPYPNIQSAAGPPGSSGIGWGHWNDPDYLGPGLGMTSTQAQSQFSMWAIVAAPLILGSDPRLLSSTSINMLKNSRVIAIDQDSLGVQGWLLSRTRTRRQVWVKPLAGGARAVALFNRGLSAQRIATTAAAAGLQNARRYGLLNVWTNQTSTTHGTISALVQPGAAVLCRVTAG